MALKRNLIANYLGQGWTALMGLAFIPLYIKYLGIESYGLIGLIGVLQAWLGLLDMGMTPTLNREMARFTGGTHSATSIRDLLRSIEFIAFGIALLVGLGIWLASGWLASDWLRAKTSPPIPLLEPFPSLVPSQPCVLLRASIVALLSVYNARCYLTPSTVPLPPCGGLVQLVF